MKPDPGLDAARREAEERERQMREREERERERERQRREREERERKEREEKLRKEQQEREQRERERERKEKERREMERREMERERMLQQQRLNDSSKMARDRSPMRNGDSDIRVKEEPRKDEAEMLMRADPRYQMAAWQMAGRHPAHMLPPHLSRGMIPPSSLMGLQPHYPPGPPGWPSPLDPYRDPYRLMDPMLRNYQIGNPMLEAMRVEEANKAYAMYRAKDPSPVPQPGQPPPVPSPHHRLPPAGQLKAPGPSPVMANDMHKKEDAR
jgi:autism susceptibility gene 2 protein